MRLLTSDVEENYPLELTKSMETTTNFKQAVYKILFGLVSLINDITFMSYLMPKPSF